MNSKLVEKIFVNRINELSCANEIFGAVYRMYLHELLANEEAGSDFSEEYFKKLVEATSPVIEKNYEEQDEDGSIKGDIFATSLFISLMCITSRVYENLDSIFARDCIHAGLDAAHYFLVNKIDIKTLEVEGKSAMLWAFCELSRTDVEIKNAYDHSMMAGMPQKMSRQKKYKMLVNQLVRELFSDDSDNGRCECKFNFDLKLLSSMIILLDTEDIFSDEVKVITKKWLFVLTDKIINSDLYLKKEMQDEVLMIATLACENILNKDSEIQNGSESNLIKVIEYNVISQKKKLSETEKNEINDRKERYLKVLENT